MNQFKLKFLKALLSLLALISFTSFLQAQSLQVKGKVTDAISQKPLEGISLLSSKTKMVAISSAEGDFVLNMPYVNQYDVTASLLTDFFTDTPNYTPYTLTPHDPRVFNAEQAMKKYNRTIDWRKIMQGPALDKVEDIKKEFNK